LAEGSLALAISRGGAVKRYRYSEPNEDAVGFAHGPGGVMLAVADGHGGYEAAEQAVDEVLALAAEWIDAALPGEPWEDAAARFVAHTHDAIRARGVRGGRPEARTTLGFALARPAEDWWAWASAADSHVVGIAREAVSEVGPNPGKLLFLGSPMREADELGLRVGREPLTGVRGLALASDGLSERGIGVDDPPRAVGDALATGARHPPGVRPLETARALVEIALASHRDHDAGDNIACAIWLRP
jgi:serine/threonine protein phosphatase PrpC